MNVLFIGGQGRVSDANGVCIRNMAREMRLRGHNVWILAMGREHSVYVGEQDGAMLVETQPSLFWRLTKYDEKSHSVFFHFFFRIICLFRHLLLFLFFPNVSPLRAKKVARIANKLVKSNDIKLVVSTFCPYENIYAGIHLKKIYGKDLRVVSYYLDLLTGAQNPSKLIRDFVYRHAIASMVKDSAFLDKILVPYSGEKDFEGVKGIDREKLSFVGLPVYIPEKTTNPCPLPFDKGIINISYVGSLYSGNRDPRYILDLLEKALNEERIKVMVHFWGDMRHFENYINTSKVAAYHGCIDNGYVGYIMERSDFLLNIGNAITYDMLPSKVFSMFATGKPIINVVAHPLDATIPYFARYNHSVDINEYEKNVDDENNLLTFIKDMKGKNVLNSDRLFEDFTPASICDLVEP